MPKISVLLPSAYPDKLERFLKNLREKSYDFEALEIIVVLDGNAVGHKKDNITYVYHPLMSPIYRSKLFETAYRASTGDWIWLANDDLEILTDNWDKDLDLSDPWKLLHFADNDYTGEFACHPLTSRKAWELMDDYGLIFPPYVNMGCDTTIWDCFPYQKQTYLPHIKLYHDRFLDANKQRELELDYVEYFKLNPVRERVKREIFNLCGLVEDRVMIATPTAEMGRRPEFYIYREMLQKPGMVLNAVSIGQSVAQNRNIMIRQAIDNGCTHVFFLDDDTAVKPDALIRLLKRNKDIITGLYLKRNYPHAPIIYDREYKEGSHFRKNLGPNDSGLIEIVSAGLGCCLIKIGVFKNMKEPWMTLGEINPVEIGEDISFFNRARKAGYKIYCDLDCKVGHMGLVTIWPEKTKDGWISIYDTKGPGKASVPQISDPVMEEAHAGV